MGNVILHSQVCKYKLTEKEKKYLQTIRYATSFLKNHPTNYIDLKDTAGYSWKSLVYSSLIREYFNKEKMISMLRQDTAVFNPEAKIYLLYSILSVCDWCIDVVPADSIFARPMRYNSRKREFIDGYEENEIDNGFEIYFFIEKKETEILSCLFDPTTSRFILIDPVSILGQQRSMVDRFLKRQKNYYDINSLNK